MTDDQMHARLREAGERWRGANTATADSGNEELVFAPARQSHRRRWLAMASAAVVAAALVVAGVTLLNKSDRRATGGTENVGVGRLEGVQWIDKVSGAWATFTARTVRISDGCQSGTYTLRVAGDRWTIGRQIGPLSVCPEAPPPPTGFYHRQYEQRAGALTTFFKAMTGVAQWGVSGQTLVVHPVTGRTVELMTKRGLAMSVYDNPWQLAHVVHGQDELPGNLSAGSLTFDRNGSVHGDDICNELTGSAVITDTNIVFKQLAMTERACVDPLQANASALVDKVLGGSVSLAVGLGALTLSDPSGDELVYVPVAGNQNGAPSQLTGQTWNLTSVQFGDDVFAQPRKPVTPSHLTFFGSSYEATHRCYTRAGASNIADGSLTLTGSRAIDTIPCPQIPNSALNTADGQESQAVDAILDGTVQWTQRGNTLTLHKDGAGTLVYTSTGTGTSTAAAKFSGAIWRLVTIESGPSATTPSGRVFLQRFAGTIAVNGCASPGIGFITLEDGQLGVSDFHYSSPCQNPLLSSANRAALTTILAGHLTWSITGNQLTITKHGVGALGFVRK